MCAIALAKAERSPRNQEDEKYIESSFCDVTEPLTILISLWLLCKLCG